VEDGSGAAALVNSRAPNDDKIAGPQQNKNIKQQWTTTTSARQDVFLLSKEISALFTARSLPHAAKNASSTRCRRPVVLSFISAIYRL
jgi:hypothetical protein